jgi:hypothetical protein
VTACVPSSNERSTPESLWEGFGAADLRTRLRHLAESGMLDLAPPGGGQTAERLRRLAGVAAGDLQLARLAEAHLDAITILREATRDPLDNALYGVWASEAPAATLHLVWTGEAESGPAGVLSGRKAFCTGMGLVDRALVTARLNDDVVLLDIAAGSGSVAPSLSSWFTTAFADTNTASIEIEKMAVTREQVVGPPNWYLERIGFWHGALAPAACWAGGAIGLIDHCLRIAPSAGDDHVSAHLGVLDGLSWELQCVLRAAGDEVDESAPDSQAALRHAYRVRAAIERLVTLAVDHAVRAYGPRILALDRWASQRVSELQLYVRQHHDTRDHAALGRAAVAAR